MGLTRKTLSALGLDAEKIDEVISAHTETVNALKDQIDKAQAENEKLKADNAKVPELEKQVKELEKKISADAEANKGRDYDALKKEFDDYKAEQERKAVRAGKEAAYKDILKDAGIPERHWAKILKYSDVDGLELDDKGKATTAKDILKSVREEWGDHIEQKNTEGAKTETPPAGTGATGKTKADILAIKDRNERQQAISENHALFGY